ncbi:c-type cytochrome domain-containing protein [Schlesneria sp. T3-172]|uniref:c-type cytochrome domain-containing protein n=1 Tax=Schlesneria TaxID=656899 RepID=UPI002EDBFB98
MQRSIPTFSVCCLLILGWMVGSVDAALTAEQRKELKEITSQVSKITSLISKKKFEEAEEAIQSSEERVAQFVKDAGLNETDPALKPVQLQLEKARTLLSRAAAKAGGGGGAAKGGSIFAKNIAPILVAKCVSCHTEDGKGGLNLDTFADLEKGGASGKVVVPGSAENSLLIRRLVAPDAELRMPKGAPPLSEQEILAIGAWIEGGAKFEGDKDSPLASLAKGAATGKPVTAPRKAEIVKSTGKETVQFMRDLMPEMVDTCGRCHNDTTKRSGFSVMSFEKLMKGGSSGAVIVAGNLEESRLWRLVNGDDTPVMPAGNQTGITRKWYDNLKTWILEGATFDGDDPKKNFPTQEERQAAAMAKYTPEQWVQKRKDASLADWKKTFPNIEPNVRESNDFLFYGDVSEERLSQLDKWAAEQVAALRQTFKVKDDPLWKGKLAVFVFKERFGYEEFNNSVHRREVPREVTGHSQVSPTLEEAFIALQDIGDTPSDSSPGMQVNLVEHATGAFLKRGGSNLPDWLIRGAGLAIAHRKAPGNVYLIALPRVAGGILQESQITEPETIFSNGTFAPGEVGPIGFTLVEYLLKRGDVSQFNQFVQRLQSGTAPDAAIKAVYNTDAKTVAMGYASSLPSGVKKGKK